MNILIVCRYLNRQGGGSNYSLHATANYLEQSGHNVSVQATQTYCPFQDQEYESDRLLNSPSSSVQEIKKVEQYLHDIGKEYDIIHIYNPLILLSGGIYRKRGGKTPVVGRLNTYPFCSNLSAMRGDCYKNCTISKKYAHDAGKKVEKTVKIPKYIFQTIGYPKLLNYVDLLVAISPIVKDVFVNIGVNPKNTTVIPNASEILKQKSSRKQHKCQKLHLLYVGRLEKQKGVDLLIDSVADCEKDNLISLDIVGDGDEMQALQEQAREVKSRAEIKFHGRVDHSKLPKYYSNCDIFIHPGQWPEPFGRTIIEALEFECPLIVSDIGAPPWIAGSAAIRFEDGNRHELTEQIEILQENGKKLEELSKNAEKRFETFLEKNVYPDLESAYKNII